MNLLVCLMAATVTSLEEFSASNLIKSMSSSRAKQVSPDGSCTAIIRRWKTAVGK